MTEVILETTAGNMTVTVHEDWAPVGAKHWLMLVGEGYYNGAPFFRVIDGFMAQCGFSGDFELTSKHLGQNIKDDPMVEGNRRGTLSFGNTGMPNSRSSHFFINFKDNHMLDKQQVPFPAFAEVTEGIEVLDGIHRTGENPRDIQAILGSPGGIDMFMERYPEATIITKAYIKE